MKKVIVDKEISSYEFKKLDKEVRKFKMLNPVEYEKNFKRKCFFSGIPYDKKDEIVIKTSLEKPCKTSKFLVPHLFGIVEFEGELYSKAMMNFVKTKDTKRSIPIDLAVYTSSGNYFENKDALYYSEHYATYIEPHDLVVAEDTGEKISKCNSYRSEGKYYQFRNLCNYDPTLPMAPLRFNYQKFPEETKPNMVGVEFEFGGGTKTSVEILKSKDKREVWASVRDGSLDSIRDGIEFVSTPLEISEMNKVSEFLDFANKNGATIHDCCGFHVHVSAKDMNFMDITSLISLCYNIEKDVFRLLPPERGNNKYCRKLNENFKGFVEVKDTKDKQKAGEILYENQHAGFKDRHKHSKYVDAFNNGGRGIRYQWINIDRIFHKRETPNEKTIEFRPHHATFDAVSFINFVYLSYYIVQYAKRHSKEVCKKSTLSDVVSEANYKHRNQLKKYISCAES